jgi:sodium-dependent dicarboxylate transporter 2/3/5
MEGRQPDDITGQEAVGQTLSPAEQRFERWRSTVGFFAGPMAALSLYWMRMPSLDAKAHTLAAILGWVIVWWMTEPVPIPVTALLGAVLCVLLKVATVKEAFAPFAEEWIFLFMGSFMLAEAMVVHGLNKRFAYGIMSLRAVGDSPGRLLFVYGAAAALLSMWISNTATTAMMFPIGLGIVATMADVISRQTGKKTAPTQLRFGTAMMLMAAYAASVGGIGTPVGTPPNLLGIGLIEKFTNVKISFFQWMLFAVPLLLVMYPVLFFLLYLLHKPEMKGIEHAREYVRAELKKLGRWTPGQRNTCLAFSVAVVLWVIPGFLAAIWGPKSPIAEAYNARVPEAGAAIIAAVLLFLLPVNWKRREFTLTWRQAARIDWGTLLLFGGGLSLGGLMSKTGLAEAMGKGLLDFCGASSLWSLTLAAIVIAVLVSEFSSNTASASMVVPVIVALALAAKVNPVPPAIGATLGASWGFMLPVSTPPNAIVYGSGMIPITKMIRAGILFDIAGAIIIWLGLRILLPLVGLG